MTSKKRIHGTREKLRQHAFDGEYDKNTVLTDRLTFVPNFRDEEIRSTVSPILNLVGSLTAIKYHDFPVAHFKKYAYGLMILVRICGFYIYRP